MTQYTSLQELLTASTLTGFDFIYDNKAHSVEHGLFKGWYIARSKGEHRSIRIHKWSDGTEYSYSNIEDSLERHKIDSTLSKLLIQEKEREQKLTASASLAEWNSLKLCDLPTDYEQRKQVTPSSSVKRAYNHFGSTSIYVPMFSDWGYTGHQSINTQTKVFLSGQRSKGCYHLLGFFGPLEELVLRTDVPILLCEGWATGESLKDLWGKVRGECQVVVCFSADNLVVVSQSVRRRFPENPVVVAADNDQWKGPSNKGLESAQKVCETISASLLSPVFSPDSGLHKPTDWNDLLLLEPDSAKAQTSSHKIFLPPRIHYLGYVDKDYFLSSSSNPQILSFSDLSDTQLLNLQPLSYWQTHYGRVNSKGDVIVDWLRAKSDLMERCRRCGLYEMGKLKGRGFWLHDGRPILHTGTHIYDCSQSPPAKGEVRDYGKSYMYKEDVPLLPFPLADDMPTQMLTSLQALNWSNPSSPHLLLGWIIQAFMSGASQWRTHIWLTGERGAGKSTVLNYVINPVFSSWKIKEVGKTTEAGIRQGLRSDSVPVLMDEFEPTGPHVERILHLLRASSTGMPVSRGTQNGEGADYHIYFPAIMASIHLPPMDPADESRIILFDLRRNEHKTWDEMKRLLEASFNANSSRGILWWLANGGVVRVLAEQERLRRVFEAKGMDGRDSMQYGCVMGAVSAFLGGVDESVVESVFAHHKVNASESGKGEDYTECLELILSAVVRTSEGEKTVSQAIKLNLKEDLERVGVRVDGDNLAVWVNSRELRLQLPEKYKSYAPALMKIKDSKKCVVRIGGVLKKCILVKNGASLVEKDELRSV